MQVRARARSCCVVVAVGRYVHGGVSLLQLFRRLLLVLLSPCDPSSDCKQGAEEKQSSVCCGCYTRLIYHFTLSKQLYVCVNDYVIILLN